MAEERGNRYAAVEGIEAIFADKDSNDENFDCGYHLDIIPDRENKGYSESSNLDIHIECLTLQKSNKAESLTGKHWNKITVKNTY